MNTLDQWFIKNWEQARDFEKSMDLVRASHEQIMLRIVEKTSHLLPELDLQKSRGSSFDGQIVFSKIGWPSARTSYPSGIWLSGIGLDNLAANEGDNPNLSIWLELPRNSKIDCDRLKSTINSNSSRILNNTELEWKSGGSTKTCGWYAIPEKREALVKMLLDGDGQHFVDYLAEQVYKMAGFIKILDEALIQAP